MNTKTTAFLVSGATGFAAARFVFDCSTKNAVIAGLVIGAIGVALISINTSQAVINP